MRRFSNISDLLINFPAFAFNSSLVIRENTGRGIFVFIWQSNIKVGRILRSLNLLTPYKTKMTGSPGFIVTDVTSGQLEVVAERVERRTTLFRDQDGDWGELYPNARGFPAFASYNRLKAVERILIYLFV